MLKYSNKKVIEVDDWDELVKKTYGKPYNYQQQNGCQERGTYNLTIPSTYDEEEDMNDSIPEEINGNQMGVKFNVWLSRDPKALVNGHDGYMIALFWERNFYPSIHTLANDLYSKGLIKAGNYVINIDW
jgi:hypothetical protein